MPGVPTLIPAGYTYINSLTYVTRKTYDAFDDLLKKLDKRDPDLFHMYIYHDYFNGAQLDLVDKQLSAIHSRIVKKEWDAAFQLLDILNLFLDQGALTWPMAHDGERVEITDRVYGACLITVLRALNHDGRLDVEHRPTLETFLRSASTWGRAVSGMRGMRGMGTYYPVLNGIGARLFKDKAPEAVALEKARVEEWVLTLPADEQEEARRRRAAVAEDEDGDGDDDGDDKTEVRSGLKDKKKKKKKKKEWFERGGADADDDQSSFGLSKVWKEYKGYLQGCATKPLRGPPEWDLSRWSEAQRAEFSFDCMDEFCL